MLHKFTIAFLSLLLYSVPINAQSVRVNVDYQSFRPFIHFQLRFGKHRHRHYRYSRGYRRAYLRGYMDGVNAHHRYRRYHEIRVYKSGYNDGFRDRGLLIRLKGRGWWRRHRFSRRDYDSPSVAVRVWLKHLSIAFVKGHGRKMPKRWKHRQGHHWNRGWYGKYHHQRHHHRHGHGHYDD